MIEQIVVGLDQGSNADHAVRIAIELVAALGARVELVHAVRVDPQPEVPGALASWRAAVAEAETAARRSRLAHLARLLDHAPYGARLEDLLVLETGRPADVVLRHARQRGADLIVLGAHHDGGSLALGGTTRRVIAEARCPVWIQAHPARRIERITVVADPERGLADELLEVANLLASRLVASIRVLDRAVDVRPKLRESELLVVGARVDRGSGAEPVIVDASGSPGDWTCPVVVVPSRAVSARLSAPTSRRPSRRRPSDASGTGA